VIRAIRVQTTVRFTISTLSILPCYRATARGCSDSHKACALWMEISWLNPLNKPVSLTENLFRTFSPHFSSRSFNDWLRRSYLTSSIVFALTALIHRKQSCRLCFVCEFHLHLRWISCNYSFISSPLCYLLKQYQLDSLKSRLQTQRTPISAPRLAALVYREEGIAGFYRGIWIPIVTISFVRACLGLRAMQLCLLEVL
jgi:hypothetical protein